MALNTAQKKHMDAIRFGLIAVAVLLGAWAAARVVGYYTGPARAEERVARAMAQNTSDPNEAKPHLEKAREAAEALKKQNLFSKEPPKEHPVKQIDAILGSEALIGDKWYKAGDKVGDANIVSVEPTRVTVEWQGRKKVFSPFGAADDRPSGPSSGPSGPVAKKAPEPKKGEPEVKTAPVKVTVAPTPADDDPLAWLGIELSPELRAILMEKWNSASDEEKAEAKERWNNMSQSEKEEAMQSMERMGNR